jgi:hypothetical protein
MEKMRTFVRIVFCPLWKWIVEGLVGIVGVVDYFSPKWGVYLKWTEIKPLLPWYWWVIIGVTAWALLTALEAVGVVNANKNKRASVSVKGTASSFHHLALAWQAPSPFDSDSKPTLVLKSSMPIRYCNLKKGDGVIPDTEFLHVDFINNRARKDEIPTAHKISAQITFFSAQTKYITHDFRGRWEGVEPEHDGIFTLETSDQDEGIFEVSIPSNGFTRRRLNIAVRFGNDSFVFNNDWYRMIRAEVFALTEKRYYVRVRLSGETIKLSEYWFELTNDEAETILTRRRKPIGIGRKARALDTGETSTRESFLRVFKSAMRKLPKKKRRKKRK